MDLGCYAAKQSLAAFSKVQFRSGTYAEDFCLWIPPMILGVAKAACKLE